MRTYVPYTGSDASYDGVGQGAEGLGHLGSRHEAQTYRDVSRTYDGRPEKNMYSVMSYEIRFLSE